MVIAVEEEKGNKKRVPMQDIGTARVECVFVHVRTCVWMTAQAIRGGEELKGWAVGECSRWAVNLSYVAYQMSAMCRLRRMINEKLSQSFARRGAPHANKARRKMHTHRFQHIPCQLI